MTTAVHPRVPAAEAAAPRGAAASLRHVPALLFGGLLAAISVAGLPYYYAAAAERVRHPLHPWLRPSGYIGQSAGIIAFALFVFLWLYPLRKKFAALAFTGAITRWLDVHVAAGLLMPLAAGVHAGWHFRGLIGVGFAATLIVAASGVLGRYVYIHIPRRRDGLALSRDEAAAGMREIAARLAAMTQLDLDLVEHILAPPSDTSSKRGLAGTIVQMVRDDLARHRAVKELLGWCMAPGGACLAMSRRELRTVIKLARREMALAQQVRMLDATHRIFRFWHVAHRPIAVSALVSVFVHVAVVVYLGTTWLN